MDPDLEYGLRVVEAICTTERTPWPAPGAPTTVRLSGFALLAASPPFLPYLAITMTIVFVLALFFARAGAVLSAPLPPVSAEIGSLVNPQAR